MCLGQGKNDHWISNCPFCIRLLISRRRLRYNGKRFYDSRTKININIYHIPSRWKCLSMSPDSSDLYAVKIKKNHEKFRHSAQVCMSAGGGKGCFGKVTWWFWCLVLVKRFSMVYFGCNVLVGWRGRRECFTRTRTTDLNFEKKKHSGIDKIHL